MPRYHVTLSTTAYAYNNVRAASLSEVLRSPETLDQEFPYFPAGSGGEIDGEWVVRDAYMEDGQHSDDGGEGVDYRVEFSASASCVVEVDAVDEAGAKVAALSIDAGLLPYFGGFSEMNAELPDEWVVARDEDVVLVV